MIPEKSASSNEMLQPKPADTAQALSSPFKNFLSAPS